MKLGNYHQGRHLLDEQLGDEIVGCPICNHHCRIHVLPIQSCPSVSLLRCSNCFAVSVSRLPTVDALDDYYRNYYTATQTLAVTTDSPERIAKRIAKYSPCVNEMKILDFGGGDGSIGIATLRALEVSGRVTVVDYDHQRFVDETKGITVNYKRKLTDLAETDFDLVIASAVLEHIPRPIPVLVDLMRLVRPGGSFYARTPYIVPLMTLARRFRVKIDFTFPAHLHDFGQPFWDELLNWLPNSGMDVLSSRPSPVETGMRTDPAGAVAAFALKAPWHFLGKRYPYVGGWECALVRRQS